MCHDLLSDELDVDVVDVVDNVEVVVAVDVDLFAKTLPCCLAYNSLFFFVGIWGFVPWFSPCALQKLVGNFLLI